MNRRGFFSRAAALIAGATAAKALPEAHRAIPRPAKDYIKFEWVSYPPRVHYSTLALTIEPGVSGHLEPWSGFNEEMDEMAIQTSGVAPKLNVKLKGKGKGKGKRGC